MHGCGPVSPPVQGIPNLLHHLVVHFAVLQLVCMLKQVLHVGPALDLYDVLLIPIVILDPLACGSPRPVDEKHSVHVPQVMLESLKGLLWVDVRALELAWQEVEVVCPVVLALI